MCHVYSVSLFGEGLSLAPKDTKQHPLSAAHWISGQISHGHENCL